MRVTPFVFLLVLFVTGVAGADEDNRALLKAKMQAQIEAVANDLDGVMGVAIKDLTANDEILVRADLTFPTASTVKVPVLLTLLQQVEEGKYKLTDQRKIMHKDQVSSPVLQFFGDGTSSLSLHDLAVLMIRHSDNIATNNLIDQAGMPEVNALMDRFGLKQIRLRRLMIDQQAAARGNENIATPRDAMKLMELIHREQAVSASVSRQALAFMKLRKSTPFTSAVPQDVVVASKTGTNGGVRNEWGVIYVPNRPFAIAVMTNYVQGDASDAVSQVAKIAYEYFARLGTSNPYGARVPLDLLNPAP